MCEREEELSRMTDFTALKLIEGTVRSGWKCRGMCLYVFGAVCVCGGIFAHSFHFRILVWVVN